MNSQTVTVNLVPGLSTPAVVRISQYDYGRPILFKVMDGTMPASFVSGTVATVVGTKPSGLGFSEVAVISGNTASLDSTLAMTQECGMIPAEIRFSIQNGPDIGTANFILAVEPSPHPNGTTDGTQQTMADLETRLQGEIDALDTRVGTLSDLTTSTQTDLVSAINEVDANTDTNTSAIGTLSNLTTTAKTNLVSAVNEIDADITDVKEDLEQNVDSLIEGERVIDLSSMTWVAGRINGSGADFVGAGYSWRTSDYAEFTESKITIRDVNAKSTFRIQLYAYNKTTNAFITGSLQFSDYPLNVTFTIDPQYKYRFMYLDTSLAEFPSTSQLTAVYNYQATYIPDDTKLRFGEYLTTWERGGFYASTGGNASSYTYAIRSPFFSVANMPIRVTCDSGYKFILFNRDSNGNKISSTAWVTEAYSDYNADSVRIMLMVDGDTTSPGDFKNGKHVKIEKVLPTSTLDFYANTLGLSMYNSFANLTPTATWVDDNGGSDAEMSALSNLLDELTDTTGFRMKLTLAVNCDNLDSEANYSTNLATFQSNGCHIANHGYSWQDWIDHWDSNEASYNPDECEKALINGNVKLLSEDFLEPDYFIYPGGHTNTELDARTKKWCKCGVLAGVSDGICHLAGVGRFRLKRCFIRVESSLSETTTAEALTRIKGYIDTAVANNDWMIFGTHSGTAAEFDHDLCVAVINYAKQQGMTFKTLNEAYKEREWMFKLSESLS